MSKLELFFMITSIIFFFSTWYFALKYQLLKEKITYERNKEERQNYRIG